MFVVLLERSNKRGPYPDQDVLLIGIEVPALGHASNVLGQVAVNATVVTEYATRGLQCCVQIAEEPVVERVGAAVIPRYKVIGRLRAQRAVGDDGMGRFKKSRLKQHHRYDRQGTGHLPHHRVWAEQSKSGIGDPLSDESVTASQILALHWASQILV